MRILGLIFLIGICGKSFCQRNQPAVLDNNRYQFGMAESRIEIVDRDTIFVSKSMFKSNSTNMIEEVEKKYRGTPIYNNAWFPNCTIYLGGKATKGTVAYNLLNREVQFSTGDVNKPIAIKPDSFTVNTLKFIHLIKTVKNAHNVFYQQVFKTDRLSLYKAFECAYRPKVYGQNTSYEINSDNFE